MAPLLLAACGGSLDTPDLTKGDVVVQIDGASQGAFAYVLGKPEIYAGIAPDGTVTLPDVPVGTTKIVVFDGRPYEQDGRVELVDVSVNGAERSRMRKHRDDMPRAARITANARCADDASSDGTEFEVRSADDRPTRLRGTKQGPDPVVLYPVPKGFQWKVRARHSGYLEEEQQLLVDDDDEPATYELDPDD